MTVSFRWLGPLLSACMVLLPAVVSAQGVASFRESVTLNTDGAAVKKLATVKDYVADEKWNEAVAILDEVSAAHAETLIAVSPGRYVTVPTYCNLVLAGLPAEALAVYRRQTDPQARQWFETAVRGRDAALMERVVRRAFASRFGDDALLRLGEWAWEQGATAAARHYWQQMLPYAGPTTPGEPLPVLRYPDTDHDPAQVRARIVLSYLMEGDFRRATAARQEFAARHPDAEGELAGRTGRLAEILDAVAQDARQWTFRTHDDAVRTFALNQQRNKILPRPVDVGKPLYTKTIPQPPLPREPGPARMLDRRPLSYHPVVLGRMLLLCDADHIYGLDLPTGQPYYSVPAAADDAPPEDSLLRAVLYQSAVAEQPIQPVVGVPRYTLTLHEGRVYARMGSPVTGRARHELRTLQSDLICFDPLLDQGRLVWKVPAAELGAGWTFEGSPVVGHGKVYAAVRRGDPQVQLAVACFDAESGRRLWQRDICAAVGKVDESYNVVSSHLLTLAENTVFYSTDLGAIAAVDAHDGAIRWIATYESRPETSHAALNDQTRQGLTPCLFHRGTVIAAPNDSPDVMAFDAETGVLTWRTRLPDRIRHLLGVGHDRVIVSGDSLWGLNVATGAREWGDARRDPETFGYGRGLLVEDVVYWPQRRRIAVVDQRTGIEVDQIDLTRRAAGGNLTIADGRLIITMPDALHVLGEASGVLERWKNLTVEQPRSARHWFGLAYAAEADGRPDAALTHYRKAAELVRDGDEVDGRPLRPVIAERLHRLLMSLGRQAADRGNAAAAAARFSEAAQAAADDTARLTALVAQAEEESARGHPGDAVAVWQQILAEPPLAALALPSGPVTNPASPRRPGFSSRPAATVAQASIARLIEQHGRDLYAKFGREAEAHFRAAADTGDAALLRALLARYPNARTRGAFALQLAVLEREQGNALGAMATYRQALGQDLSPPQRETALRELAHLLDEQRYWSLAAAAWRTWAIAFPAAEFLHDGRRWTATDFVTAHLAQEPYSSLGTGPPLPLRRAWQRDFSERATVIVPEGTAPAPRWACVLVNDSGLQCIDLADGRARWTHWPDAPAVWAAFAGPNLLYATSRGTVRAVAVEDGTTRWEHAAPLSPADEAEPWWRWAVAGELLVCLDRGERVIARDVYDGRWLWEFRYGTGRLQRRWLCDGGHIVVQSLRPDRTLILDAAAGRLRADHAGDREPWLSSPVRFDGERFAFVTAEKRVQAVSSRAGQPDWTYDGPLSSAHADPALLSDGERLLLVIDGDTLAELDPATGRRRWSRPLARRPTPDAADRAALFADRLCFAEAGIARCVNLTDGTLAWERSIGPGDGPLRMQTAGKYLIAHPTESRTEPTSVSLLEAATGWPVQTLHIASDGGPPLRFHATPAAGVLIAGHQLTGFRQWTGVLTRE